MFLQQGLWILVVGLLPGLLGSFAAGMGLRSMFAEMVSLNLAPPILLTATIVGSTVLVATLVPARRAASVDPLAAIRYE
jgi:ABC-type antimicrobial peptide transport system permease subunit